MLPTRLALLLLLAAAPAAAAGHPADATRRLPLQLHARAVGELIEVEGSEERAELLTFGEGLVDGLLMVGFEEEVAVADWPVGPGERAHVRLTRRDVYAPDAVIWEVGEQGRRQLPRSKLVFLWGRAEADEDVRVMVSADPETKELRGFSTSRTGRHELHPLPASWPYGKGRLLLGPPNLLLGAETARAVETNRECGQRGPLPKLLTGSSGTEVRSVTAADGITTKHTARIGVDTDNELLASKFGNDTDAATSYIASLFAAMNTIYERDLLVRLLQGVVILRPSTGPADPYSSGMGSASVAHLNEFTNHWQANRIGGLGYLVGQPTHALVMLLSGKSSSNNSASGIAWLNTLCNQFGGGYSVNHVFKFAQQTASNDDGLVGHELGHNFGSPHTHCYSPPIDTCYNAEPGCYAGGTSCPPAQTINTVANVRGTIMSYCHLLGGCTASDVFHPTTEDLLDDIILGKTLPAGGACIVPLGPSISTITPNNGPTSGGTVVTILGSEFVGGTTVTLGGVPPTSFSIDSLTQITATSPAMPTGTVSVEVTDPNLETASTSFFYTPPSEEADFHTLTPCRLLDTRNANGPLGGPALGVNQQRVFAITGVCGIPSDAISVSVNLTVVSPTAAGSLSLFPGNAFPLGTTNLDFTAGRTVSSNAMLMLSTDGNGQFGVLNGSWGTSHFVLDVNGYFVAAP